MSFSMAKRSRSLDNYKNSKGMYENLKEEIHTQKRQIAKYQKEIKDFDAVSTGTNRLIQKAFGVIDQASDCQCAVCNDVIDYGSMCAPCNVADAQYKPYSHSEPEELVDALAHRNDPTIGRANFRLPMPNDVKPEVVSKPAFEDEITGTLFERATKRHDRLAEAWGELIVDPLNALTYSSLFDVSVPKTADFIEAYGEVQDLASIFNNRAVTDAEAERYYRAVARAEVLWDAALNYADRRNYNWLPEDERKLAHQADHLLRMANDEGQTEQARMNYAKRAVVLMEKIYTIKLPTEMKLALEAKTTLALTAPIH